MIVYPVLELIILRRFFITYTLVRESKSSHSAASSSPPKASLAIQETSSLLKDSPSDGREDKRLSIAHRSETAVLMNTT